MMRSVVQRSLGVQVQVRQRMVGASSSCSRGFSTSSLPLQLPASNTAVGVAAAGFVTLLALGASAASSPDAASKAEHVAISPVSDQIVEETPKEEPSTLPQGIDLEELQKKVDILTSGAINEAFVFVKPHAATEKATELVRNGLLEAGIRIAKEGTLSHDVIDEQKFIDTHYGAIASKAVELKPEQLNVPAKGKAGFENMFREKWEDAVKQGKVYNAADACKKLGIDGAALDEKWSSLKRGENLIKFGGGFYCGKVDNIYVMNGFYMAMRAKYTEPPAKIQFFVVEWNPQRLSWEDFRGKVLGGTDPKEAEPGSLRRTVLENWESLGLPAMPNVGDNGVHASASPFEACAERTNWLGARLDSDRFGKAALALGIDQGKLTQWMEDAQVKHLGKTQSIFDILEDIDTADVLAILEQIKSEN